MRLKYFIVVLSMACLAPVSGWSQSANKLDDLVVEETGTEPGEATLETDTKKSGPVAELYGFVQTDAGYNAGRIHPDWFDTVRPSELPSYENEFGEDGDAYFSVRQTRFGIKSWLPTNKGDVKGIFEWELFGVGGDAGQTTIRLRHAYLQYGKFGAGQYWSPFMDINVFPNSLEYWGPSGMAFFRNVQVRYMPVMTETNHVTIALERPGASGDNGHYNDIIEERGIKGHFPLPDLSAEYRHSGDWGYVEVAGILRNIEWDDFVDDDIDLSGSATGWGINLSTNLAVGANGSMLRASVLYGEGIENYMNDSTADIAVVENPDNTVRPLTGELIPVWGLVAFYDINWNDQWTSSVGFSMISLDYDDTAALPDTFDEGRYALANVQYHPVDQVMFGAELQYGARDNFSDGWTYDAFRVQFSFRYRYSMMLGGNQ
jgi:hypothetical protein